MILTKRKQSENENEEKEIDKKRIKIEKKIINVPQSDAIYFIDGGK